MGTLRRINEETTNQITLLKKQEGQNELIQKKVEAEGNSQPFAQHAKSFVAALNETGVSVSHGMQLYHTLKQAEHHNVDTKNLASGRATMFLSSEDMKLNIRDVNLGWNGSNDGEHDHYNEEM